jgi:ubiquinone/menaquinone biosynthesis C-methylase UbiE
MHIFFCSCGPGTFLCEMAADYPKSRYVGVDLYPIFPNIKPHNVNFIQCNLLKGLPFEENTFDFVHIRFLILELSEFDWENFVIKELTRVLKPNGWIEIMEPRIAMNNQGPTTESMINASE